MVEGIPAAQFDEHAARIRPHLERIERHDKDGVTAAEYEREIWARNLQVWSLGDFEAIAITRVTRDAVRLEWVVGRNRHHWQDQLDTELRIWGKALGKKRFLVLARPGWAALAKKRGFRERQRAYEVRL